MAGKIPQSFIDDLLDRTDIVDVIGARVDLRKAGKNHKARCPFHDEKTPSFSVNQDKQFYYCFGCSAGGNAIGFIMDYDRIDFPEAVERLAHQAGLEVPREAGDRDFASSRRNPIYETLEKADNYYRDQLRTHHAAGDAVDYLKQRGVSGQVARDFGIGLAPPGWDNLITHLAHSDSELPLLMEAGMIIEREDGSGHYDRFRHRIMFPIRDTRGRTIGFGGRVLGDEQPKYLNSPETPVFSKGRELYGLYEARSQVRDITSLLVVEGYMDVVALAQFGIQNAVATLGTAVTDNHLQKLYRYCSDVVFCFDGDNAGRKAARRALETCLPAIKDGYSARFLFLPDGEDPDTLVRRIGSEEFQRHIAEAMPLSEFLFTACGEGLNLSTPDDRAKLSQRAAPMINAVPESVFRQLLLGELAIKTGLDKDTLSTLIKPPEPAVIPESSEASGPPSEHSHSAPPAFDSADSPPLDSYANDDSHQPTDAHYVQNSNTRASGSQPSQKRPARYAMPPIHHLVALLMADPALYSQLDKELEILKTEGLHIESLEDDSENEPENSSGHGLKNASELNQRETDNPDANPTLATVFKLHDVIVTNPHYTLNHILGYWRGVYGQSQGDVLARIAATDLQTSHDNTPRHNLAEAKDIIASLISRAQRNKPVDQRLSQFLNHDLAQAQQLSSLDRSRLSGLILELAQYNPEHPLINEAKQKLSNS